jgi:hypothetical protein
MIYNLKATAIREADCIVVTLPKDAFCQAELVEARLSIRTNVQISFDKFSMTRI